MDIKVFAKFGEILPLPVQDMKEKPKCRGWTDKELQRAITELAPSPYFSIINVHLVDINVFAKFDAGLSLELSDRKKFCVIFRILGRSFGPNFVFPYMFYTFKLLPQLIIGRSEPV